MSSARTPAQQSAIEQRYALEMLLWCYQHSGHVGFKLHDIGPHGGPHFGGECEQCGEEFVGPARSWLDKTIADRGLRNVPR